MDYDVVIVGAGMAGMTAGIYLARASKKVLVLEQGAYGGQIINAMRVDNWPGDLGISGRDLMDKVEKQMIQLGAELKYEEVLNVEKEDENFRIKTDETEYLSKAVILAVGTEPRKLSKKQEESAGGKPISYCATCDGALYKGKPVAVIGSGRTAEHEMMYLEGIASKIVHLHHDEPIPEGVEAVFVAIGRVPSTEKLKGLVDLDEDGFVIADENCRTSCPGVFAIGDCRVKNVRQLVTAAGDGAIVEKAVVELLGK